MSILTFPTLYTNRSSEKSAVRTPFFTIFLWCSTGFLTLYGSDMCLERDPSKVLDSLRDINKSFMFFKTFVALPHNLAPAVMNRKSQVDKCAFFV